VSQAAGEPLAEDLPAVVIVTHDTRDEALGALASAQRAGARELVLVDSGSTDGTAEAVRARLPEVRVLELVNVGFGRAANAGVAASSSGVVVLANADVRFEPDSLARLRDELLADRSLAAVGPQVVYPDGSPQASARRIPDLGTAIGHALLGRVHAGNRFTRRYRALDADPTLPRDVDWLSGCALALRREAFEAVGGFDPGYFLYVEDVDLGVRLQAAGWRLRYTPTARVTHRVGASTGQRRARALIHHARGLDRFHDRHLARTRAARLLRPLVRLGLAGWVVATLVWERVERWAGVSRSTTGERGGPA
jgi:N-acetylglucosaminyl-diphospho-decaprenol L-rhamnosyltransferase